jgi:dihydropteroate synthase
MQENPAYGDVVKEVREFLLERIGAAEKAGISRESILIDPGIGFGKKMEHNLTLIRRIGELKALGRPIVVGVSRKGFIGTITGEPVAANRLFGTAAAVSWCIANGADILRVHDVKAMVQVMKMTRAIMQERAEE